MPNPSNPNRVAGFDAILARIDHTVLPEDDGLSRNERFEILRRQLVRFFTWERCQDPELCADETFSRVAAKIQEGHQIQNFRAYVFGVARVVRLEAVARIQREANAIVALSHTQDAVLPPHAAPEENPSAEHCLQHCLQQLSPEQRAFILRYYGGDGSARIATRKQMAAEQGLELNALRNRALRLRDRLERCCRACLERGNASELDQEP